MFQKVLCFPKICFFLAKLCSFSQKCCHEDCQVKRRGQTRFYDQNNDQINYQNRYKSNSGDRRLLFSGRIQYGQNYRDSLGIIRTIEVILGEEILEGI